MGSNEPEKCDGSGARRLSGEAPDAVFHPPRAEPSFSVSIAGMLRAACGGTMRSTTETAWRCSRFSATLESPAYSIIKPPRRKLAGRVHSAERAAEAARVAQPRGSPGVLPNAPQSQPGRCRARLAQLELGPDSFSRMKKGRPAGGGPILESVSLRQPGRSPFGHQVNRSVCGPGVNPQPWSSWA
jgi:hypothetical protein